MIYGLYMSAGGILSNSYRQDVIANNMANSETVGFKKDLALLQQRPTAAQETGKINNSNPMLENIGGGLLASNTLVDTRQGEFESTGNNLDVALQGDGYLAVGSNGKTHLTRDGRLNISRDGRLTLSNDVGQTVLDDKQTPIVVSTTAGPLQIASDGTISQAGKPVAKLGLFNVSDPASFRKEGGTLLSVPGNNQLSTASPTVRSGFVERSNVDPTTELTDLMDTQRMLEANANMIHIQDETLDKLVNDVGKAS